MMELGTALTEGATRVLMLGSGELGREVVLELMRFGVEVIACDSYANAPGMQFAHRARVFDMQDGAAVRAAVEAERPHFIVPEIEAIATDTLVELEAEGWNVIPTARAARLTMDREGIRRLAAEELGLPTSAYRFASSLAELEAAVAELGLPIVVKPVMSSSGKGQSVIREAADVERSWNYAMEAKRGRAVRVIAEAFVDFDTEITLLTVRTRAEGTLFCPPIGHRQERGDYMESWQPERLSPAAVASAEEQARRITDALGGTGLFGVEFFIKGEQVIFSELSPRPHDTGMVTMATQDMTEFELHARAILGLPIGAIRQRSPGASAVILAEAPGTNPRFLGVEQALTDPRAKLRLFAKPVTRKHRRMGVVVTYADTTEEARAVATRAAGSVRVVQDEPEV
jgi:phosphoribosylglycinamide formyltransferase 2